MELAGQGNRGYAMAALLVAMSIMAVLMGALLPVWTHMARREKEAELIFRGNQYARAIGLFQRKFANTPPPTIDVLVEQRFLRKKYKDPITNDDFQPLFANQAMPNMPGGPSGASGSTTATQQQQPRQLIQPGFGSTGATSAGGIVGVTSKSKDTSIRVYNGRSKYNEWAFVHIQTTQQPGQPGSGGMPGSKGGPNQQKGQQPLKPGDSPWPAGMPPAPGGGPTRPPVNLGQPFGQPPTKGQFGQPASPFSPGFGQPGVPPKKG